MDRKSISKGSHLLHEPCVKYVTKQMLQSDYAAASTSSVHHMDGYFRNFKFSRLGSYDDFMGLHFPAYSLISNHTIPTCTVSVTE